MKMHQVTLQQDKDLDELIEYLGDKKYVLLGEASHGTHEYYEWRARISKRLIDEKGFNFIAVEGDWPDCYRVNKYIKQYPNSAQSAHSVLYEFQRWPTWMWANREIETLTEWIKQYNAKLPEEHRVGFYGLDVYSLWESLDEVLKYVREYDPNMMASAMQAFQCFEQFNHNEQEYAAWTAYLKKSCEDEVVDLLMRVLQDHHSYARDGIEAQFSAAQNAHVIKNAESYYRTMIYPGPESWNLRDQHMFDTLQRLMKFHSASGNADAKCIVWAHNTHVGDARYTDMEDVGEFSIGQLAREAYPDEVALVGFGGYRGSVIAGMAWNAPMKEMRVPPAHVTSWEYQFHVGSSNDRYMIFQGDGQWYLETHGQRAIGVVYDPESEIGNYVPTILGKRYDAFIYFDNTHALSPIHMRPDLGQIPESYPFRL